MVLRDDISGVEDIWKGDDISGEHVIPVQYNGAPLLNALINNLFIGSPQRTGLYNP